MSGEPTERTPAELARDDQLAVPAAVVVDALDNRIPGFAGQLTPDGKKIVFGSTRDGSPQLCASDASRPGDAPERLTEGPDRVQGAVLTRDGKAVLFIRDHEGDDRSHVYRLPLEGGDPVDLTPGSGARFDLPVLPWHAPDVMVLAERAADSPASTILVGSISGAQTRAVYRDPAPAFARAAAPDGTRALVERVLSASESVLLEVDVATGAARRVWPAEGKKEAITAVAYAMDGRTAFVATDQGGDTSALLAIELSSGAVQASWTPAPPTARVDALAVAPRGDLVAARVDAGDRTELRLLDARTLRDVTRPGVPQAHVELGDFTADGRLLTIALSTPERPGDPYELEPATGKLRPLRSDPRRELAAIGALEVSTASVASFDGRSIPVHAYLPQDRGTRRLPVIVAFHDGPAGSSHLGWSLPARYFVSLGYGWVEPNVRGSAGLGRSWQLAGAREKRGDVLRDMASVNEWVRAQPWADPGRVVAAGDSFGGWMVLLALTRQPSAWAAGIDLSGAADLRTLLRSTQPALRAMWRDELGDLPADEALLAAWSPLPEAARIAAPLFVYQGANDPRVPRPESDAIVKALRRRGVAVEYFVADDEGHSLAKRENQIELLARSARFLEEHPSPARPVP